ncbi:cyclic pyranopterin monophosphate synthase MoaC [Allomuricauda sp. SCSIO 65647]|uniref:cyclic pyranopterin monophosphate synthase MoaC n=1 Tax=Allomuricauda sp. SCSIO 65647 TaxID=2908843 RepID=UPI001F2E6647|nr:cyclic pyranopterin monophosphate synthase MoaC [Muricauda sp. SCSIO 65647]UJH68743.1 cyclic pyranopterin monophosphate synthase MoaC [Muricauda sp. SCSIO 65647]
MVDITHKQNTHRTAIAQAIVTVGSVETVKAIENKKVPKGDVFEMSRAAGFLGIKKTAELLPDCHPLPIEFASVEYAIEDLEIIIKVTVKTFYKTGVEVEAVHGASLVALNIYDMLKPIDKQVEIRHIRLLEKTGGKSDIRNQ